MNGARFSIKTNLTLTIFLMGILVVIFTILTGEVYREIIFNNQQKNFTHLAKIKIHDIIEKTSQDAKEFGLSIQAEDKFKNAFRLRKKQTITRFLDENFHRGVATLGVLEIKKFQAYDRQLNLIASSTEGDTNIILEQSCPDIKTKLLNRKGVFKIKPISEICIHDNAPRLFTIVPIGGVIIKGYLLLSSNPVVKLSNAAAELATPLQIKMNDTEIIFQSTDWIEGLDFKKFPLSTYKLELSNQQSITLNFSPNISLLIDELSSIRTILLIAALIVTILAIGIALHKLRHTTLIPLLRLTKHLHNVIENKKHLEKPVTPSGNLEIYQLTQDFNKMGNELYSLYNRLENMAYTDSLTKMNNRAFLYNKLQQATKEENNEITHFALFMMDLNRFKFINDTLGHHIGDLVLQKIGERLQQVLRDDDISARLGGDEFAVILPTINNRFTAEDIAKKITAALSESILVKGHVLSIETSIGIALYPTDDTDSQNLMKYADIAMYHSKKKNINYTFYNDSMNDETLYEFTMEPKLRDAIEKQQLELYYQPKIQLSTNIIVGVEALIRWKHPELGFISPDKFIPLAERTGLIQPLTEWVLQTAYNQAIKWSSKGHLLGISVNISSLSLNKNHILDMLHKVIKPNTAIKHNWLTLELTETTIMSDSTHALKILTMLDKMNIQLSVDDFGTGYSSLAYLKKLPVDEIKIDKSFVLSMLKDNNDKVIVKSTIDLAHNMGLCVVAEGIEDIETWNHLLEMGCDLAQGFYMCKPCPPNDLDEWFSHSIYKIKDTTSLNMELKN